MNKKNIIKEFVMGVIGLIVIMLIYNAAVDYVEERKEKKRHEEIGKAVDEVFGNDNESDSKEANSTVKKSDEPEPKQRELEFITNEYGYTVGVNSKLYGSLEITAVNNYIKYDEYGNEVGPVIDVSYIYTNTVNDVTNCANFMWTSAFQNGVECEVVNEFDSWNLQIKTGASCEVFQTIYVQDFDSPVTLEIYTKDSGENFEIPLEINSTYSN